MVRKSLVTVVAALILTLSLPAFAAPANGSRDRETKMGDRERGPGAVITRVIKAVKKGVRSLNDGLTVPIP